MDLPVMADSAWTLRRQGVTLEQAQQRAHGVLAPHNTEETLLFAEDIERKALAGRWRQ